MDLPSDLIDLLAESVGSTLTRGPTVSRNRSAPRTVSATRRTIPPQTDAEKVEYLLVGGLALALHGHPRFTKDADLWVRDTPENLERVENALRAFGAPRVT